MKEYAKNFLEEYNYSHTTKNAVLSVFERIDDNALDNVLQTYQSEQDFDFAALTSLVEELAKKTGISIYTMRLFAVICLSQKASEAYAERGLPEYYFKETMRNVLYESERCKRVYDEEGIAKWESYFAVLCLKRFALGRLRSAAIFQ